MLLEVVFSGYTSRWKKSVLIPDLAFCYKAKYSKRNYLVTIRLEVIAWLPRSAESFWLFYLNLYFVNVFLNPCPLSLLLCIVDWVHQRHWLFLSINLCLSILNLRTVMGSREVRSYFIPKQLISQSEFCSGALVTTQHLLEINSILLPPLSLKKMNLLIKLFKQLNVFVYALRHWIS